MSKINDGGPAFASAHLVGTQWHPHPGMSLRDWFAGQAMQALATNAEWELLEPNAQNNFAQTAYELADAMLSARSNRGEEDNG